jgi:predicted NBD/HSP70 family sugar kinase
VQTLPTPRKSNTNKLSSRIQPSLLRQMTVRRVIELLHQRGPSSRAKLTRLSGISAPTISKAVASLLDAGLLEEGPAPQGMPGRPGNVLRLASERAQVIGIAVDADRCSVAAAGLDGTIWEDTRSEFITPGSYQRLVDTIADSATQLMRRRSAETLGIGISVPGLVNRREGKTVFSPNLHITDGHAPDADLSAALGVPCTMLQENQALCLGEQMCNEVSGNFVILDASTGLGVGIVSEGRLISGNSGLAGELGHITIQPAGRLCGCGNHGCLETVATDTALVYLVSQRLGRNVSMSEVLELFSSGAAFAEQELRSVCEYLAIAIAATINLFNPQTVFVYAQLFGVRDGVFEEVCELTRRRALAPSLADCRILRATCSKIQGAVAVAIHQLREEVGPVVA